MVDAGSVVDLLKEARDRRNAALILELDLTDGIVEGQPADPVSALLSMRRTHLRDVLDGLRRARTDPRVSALIVKIGGQSSSAWPWRRSCATRSARSATPAS